MKGFIVIKNEVLNKISNLNLPYKKIYQVGVKYLIILMENHNHNAQCDDKKFWIRKWKKKNEVLLKMPNYVWLIKFMSNNGN